MKKAWIWLKCDFLFMILIIGTVGILSYINPIPANIPLTWNEKGEMVEFTLSITPNAPGKNEFNILATVPKGNEMIKRIDLWLSYQDGIEIAPTQVPLKRSSGDDGSYVAEGYYLPFAGKWKAQVKVWNSSSQETVFEKDFRIFETDYSSGSQRKAQQSKADKDKDGNKQE